MTNFFDNIKQTITGKHIKIVLPEGTDERVLQAAVKLQREGIVTPVLIGSRDLVKVAAKQAGVELTEIEVVDPVQFEKLDEMIEQFVDRRNGKATPVQARIQLKDLNTFGTMLVYMGYVQGLVSGAAHTTAETVRPALRIIKTKPDVSKTSGAFIMVRGEERYVFADCAINIAPTSEDLAEIAVESAKTAKAFGIEPKVAMLSFSTKGSAVSPETRKIETATKLAKLKAPQFIIDGEFQFDAAFVPAVAKKKAPGSVIQGDANVFVFPSLEAGNIGYKLAERLGGFEAIGPILQGLNMPVNDLSRGCSADDVYKLVLITAAQSVIAGEERCLV
ncbi:phosphate acetyltransferase [Paenisporosarcina antarctica]|uniref:Phosphate acetyltransferase n=1 Tax=Paenisporosarcina antarctica TaxID=417367 RepID=A0A4P6ZZY1_9BACL|nr:phosphate acetyltransferase [Paenisporosarcina antarctica]QBP42151.1 phosphate acetyltransferase [Paenisporosarcina antarctica]